jgi:glycosyltransferase involved in cell wall biosynthesis
MNGVIGIDASRCRSGGAVNHLIGLIKNINPAKFKISKIHIWAYKELLEKLPKKKWILKHSHSWINGILVKQLLWQAFIFDKSAKNFRCDIVINLDAGTFSKFKPSVTMSRDMLSYETGVSQLYKFSLARLRIEVLRLVQNYSLRRACKCIFLTNYARNSIMKYTGFLKDTKIIPHGVNEDFRKDPKKKKKRIDKKLRIIYVSHTDPYKNHDKVIEAASILKQKNYQFDLVLLGNKGYCETKISNLLKNFDSSSEYISRIYDVQNSELSNKINASDIFLFASSCESMPNILLEGMASGVAIACSKKGPMPEILGQAGVYFDPKDPISISNSLALLLDSKLLRKKLANKSYASSLKYSWKRCADETLKYVMSAIKNKKNNQ